MNERDRQSRIERMKREKQRQLARRKQQMQLLRRCLIVGATVCVVLGVISIIWAVARPNVDSEKAVDTTLEVHGASETQEVTKEKGGKEAAEDDGSSLMMADTDAIEAALQKDTKLLYPVPGWQVNDTGWWYANEDNTYYASGWKTLNDKKYYFDEKGYMKTGWVAIGNKGHYFSESGVYEPDKKTKMVALTFDDGPGKYTAELLDILEANGAKATFFMLGSEIDEEGGGNIQRMQALGCELGNHSYGHPNLKTLNKDQIKEEFQKTDELIAKYVGTGSTVARAPFGEQNGDITSLIDKPFIFWNSDTEDWKNRNAQMNVDAVFSNVVDGDIFLMHDIWPETVESCKTIIPELISQGYELVTVSELASAKGVQMQNGVTYYDFEQKTLEKMANGDFGESNDDVIYDDYQEQDSEQ